MKRLLIAVLAVLLTLALVCTVFTGPVAGWQAGDEKAFFGHTFEEESWYTTKEYTNEDNATAEFGVSFLNMGNIEAFLITLNGVEDEAGNEGVLPYQMFGMHYYTENGKEVFIGALLAFLAAYNDTNDDGIPSKGEQFFYIIPFGVSGVEGVYPPTVTNKKVEKKGEGHYQMGITYKNMYAIATQNPVLTAYLATGWVYKFSEFSVTYDIKVDQDSGELTAETYYTIGQITELYAVLLGFPIKSDPANIPDNFGMSVVHFTTIFTSNYEVQDKSGNKLDTNIQKELEGDIEIDTQGTRAFTVGLRGEYDLIDESSEEEIATDEDAKNILLQAKLNDLILVAWQLGFSATVFAAMAYGLSEDVRGMFTSYEAMADESTEKAEKSTKGFGAQAFWYAVCFPEFNAYRIYHDPVYTAFFGETTSDGEEKKEPGFEAVFVVASVMILVAVYAVRSRKK